MSANETYNHVVTILEDNREANPYIVVPSRLVVQAGETILFKNITTVSVSIEFEGTSPIVEPAFPLDPTGEATKQISDMEQGTFPFPYDVFCGDKRDRAQGSRPSIIVYKR